MYFTLTWTMRFLGTFTLQDKSDETVDSSQCFSVLVVFFCQLWHWMRLSVRGKRGVDILFVWFIVRRSWASETGSFAEVPELVDLASGPHCICAGPASAEEVERRFVFHRISVVYGKQCLSIDSLCTCGHRFLLIYIFFVSSFSFSFPFPFMGGFLKETVHWL